jgi:methylornithine synthase
LKKRLHAGANVVTSIVPPGGGLAGVARPAMDIEEGRRAAMEEDEALRVASA